MTKRIIPSGAAPQVIIKAGTAVSVNGYEGDQVIAETTNNWGLKVERKNDAIEVKMGGGGTVSVPANASLKVYAGTSITVNHVHGPVDGYAGLDLTYSDVVELGNVSAGRRVSIDCQTLKVKEARFNAGSDLRFYVRDLKDAFIRVKDIGGYWEGRIGAGSLPIYLKAGGDVTLVTDQTVEALPPDYILGSIEKPPSERSG